MSSPHTAIHRTAALRAQLGTADPSAPTTMGDLGSTIEETTRCHTESEGPESPFHILPQWHSKPNHLRVICVGAGAAGLLVAYKMKKNFTNYKLVCYEKNPGVAGTWYENRYPGAACDVPAYAVRLSLFLVNLGVMICCGSLLIALVYLCIRA